jgi:hypothetical protein
MLEIGAGVLIREALGVVRARVVRWMTCFTKFLSSIGGLGTRSFRMFPKATFNHYCLKYMLTRYSKDSFILIENAPCHFRGLHKRYPSQILILAHPAVLRAFVGQISTFTCLNGAPRVIGFLSILATSFLMVSGFVTV